jgi:hypothetical protein
LVTKHEVKFFFGQKNIWNDDVLFLLMYSSKLAIVFVRCESDPNVLVFALHSTLLYTNPSMTIHRENLFKPVAH